MNSLYSCIEEMTRAWQSMRGAWDEARQSWKDSDRDQFEREHVQELGHATNTYIANLRRFAEAIQQIRNDAP